MLFCLVELAEMYRECRVEDFCATFSSVLDNYERYTEVDMALIYVEARDCVAINLHICDPYLLA